MSIGANAPVVYRASVAIDTMRLDTERHASQPRGMSMTYQNAKNAFGAGTCILALTSLLAGIVLLAPRDAAAKPEFSSQTGLPCGQCHSNPAGGGKLKAFGEKFKANGFKVK